MTQKELVKQIKSGNRSSSIYMSVTVITGFATTLAAVWIIKLFHDGSVEKNTLIALCITIAICQFVKSIFYGLGIWKAHEAAYNSLSALRLKITEHMKKLPIRFFQKKKTGDLSNIINHDVEQVEGYLAHEQPEIFISTLMVIVTGIALFVVNWKVGLAMCLPIPVMLVYLGICNKLQAKTLDKYLASTKQMNEDLVEYIATMPLIKTFSGEESRTEIVLEHMRSYLKWVKRLMFSISGSQSLGQLIMEVGIVFVIMIGFPQVIHNSLSISSFILCIVLSNLFMFSFMKYISFHHANIVLNGSASSMTTILGEKTADNEQQKHDSLNTGDIEFKDVSFRYDEREAVLQDINLSFTIGTTSALVGTSGSGKSTIANLIMGFWEATNGTVSIGGKSVSECSSEVLSKQISIVQQDTFLFNTTIAENIRIGKEKASMGEIITAAKKARIHEMILSLPNGYNTIVGESGAKLSGGEKQRISIARMMLKNTPIVILDEATAAIDPQNEQLIQEAINNLSDGKTVISIAHRLNTVKNANQIVVLDKGRVIATGRHQELIDTCSLYVGMVDAQHEVDEWKIKGETI